MELFTIMILVIFFLYFKTIHIHAALFFSNFILNTRLFEKERTSNNVEIKVFRSFILKTHTHTETAVNPFFIISQNVYFLNEAHTRV